MCSSRSTAPTASPRPQQEAAKQYVNQVSRAEEEAWTRPGVIVFGTEASIESSPNAGGGRAEDPGRGRHGTHGPGRRDSAGHGGVPGDRPEAPGAAVRRQRERRRRHERRAGRQAAGRDRGCGAHGRGARQRCVRAEAAGAAQAQEGPGLRGQDLRPGRPGHAGHGAALFATTSSWASRRSNCRAGKNLFTFPQTLSEPGFYSYDVQVDAPGDPLPQNNRATSFTTVRGEPRILVVSADPEQDRQLAAALQIPTPRSPPRRARRTSPARSPRCRATTPSSSATSPPGDLGTDRDEAAGERGARFRRRPGVRRRRPDLRGGRLSRHAAGNDAAGEHGTGQQEGPAQRRGGAGHARHGVHQRQPGRPRLRPGRAGRARAQDEMGVVLWDGTEHWLFPLQKVGDKQSPGQAKSPA